MKIGPRRASSSSRGSKTWRTMIFSIVLFLSLAVPSSISSPPGVVTDLSILLESNSGHQSPSERIDDDSTPENENETWTQTDPYANLSIQELMDLDAEDNPLRDPLSIAVPMSIIYTLILFCGLVGNFSTCLVIAKTSYMHTATNYYLFSLAMSDLLLLITGLPQDIYHIWIKYPYIFGEAFCVIRGLAAETSANATVLTITAFTVERFVAIVYPLKSHKLSQLSRVVRMIGIIWLVAFCLALPQAAQFGVKDHVSRHNPSVVLIQGAWCTLVREIFPYAFQISICVFFVIPMTIITVLYILIGLKLRRKGKGPLEPRLNPRHSQSHVVRMLVAVVVAFFICWAPFHAQRLMALYGSSQEVHSAFFLLVYQGLTHASGILYYLSTCVNPILYHIMSNKFRQAFKDTLGSFCGTPPPRTHHTRSYSAMSYRSSRMIYHNHIMNGNGQVQRTYQMKLEDAKKEKELEDIKKIITQSNGKVIGANNNPCTCSTPHPKAVTTTILGHGRKSSFVTRTHCPLCGGAGAGGSTQNGGTRGVTFGFLRKPKTQAMKRCGTDERSLDGDNTVTVTTPINSSPIEKETEGVELPEMNGKNRHSEIPVSPILMRMRLHPTVPKKSLRAFLRRKKGISSPSRLSSDPSLVIITPPGQKLLREERRGSSGGIPIRSNQHRAASNASMDSAQTNNTISNSSLQDLDEGEFTSEELAGYMAEVNGMMGEAKCTKV